MLAHRIETTINQDKTLLLKNVPFHSGEKVEVVILVSPPQQTEQNYYPLRRTAIEYIDPTEPVAQNDWEVEQ